MEIKTRLQFPWKGTKDENLALEGMAGAEDLLTTMIRNEAEVQVKFQGNVC